VIAKHKDGVSFLEFSNLTKFSGIQHAVFTRNTGKSTGPFRSLNVSFGVGDDERNVKLNRNIISQCIEEKDIVFADQVHGIRVIIFSEDRKTSKRFGPDVSFASENSDFVKEQIGLFDFDSEQRLIGDALVTNISKKFLVVQVADCQSILIYDPVRKVVANVHSGWRGSIKNIIGRTIKMMNERFGCVSSDFIAGIGPSLGPCCAEFINYQKEIPKLFWKYKDNNQHFNFWSVSYDQLGEAGVLAENVSLSRICTKCDQDRFFSFRGEGTTGRFASIIGLE
jgi:YfiH family protein